MRRHSRLPTRSSQIAVGPELDRFALAATTMDTVMELTDMMASIDIKSKESVRTAVRKDSAAFGDIRVVDDPRPDLAR